MSNLVNFNYQTLKNQVIAAVFVFKEIFAVVIIIYARNQELIVLANINVI